MNQEEQQQFRRMIREEVTAATEPLRSELIARQDRAVETIAGEFSTLRAEMNRRFERVEKRLTFIDERFTSVAESLVSIEARMASQGSRLTL